MGRKMTGPRATASRTCRSARSIHTDYGLTRKSRVPCVNATPRGYTFCVCTHFVETGLVDEDLIVETAVDLGKDEREEPDHGHGELGPHLYKLLAHLVIE